MSASHTAGATALRSAVIMVAFTAVFTALMAYTYTLTRPSIQASAEAEKLRLVNAILPPESYDNALLQDSLAIAPNPELGLDEGGQLFRARKDGKPMAVVLEAAAPDGYGGRIQLLVAIGADHHLLGVRAIAHHETPGLGDYIDPAKDRDKAHPWIAQFSGLDTATLTPQDWGVSKDGGRFAYHAGATISARAVTRAVGRVVAFVADQGDALYAPRPAKPEGKQP